MGELFYIAFQPIRTAVSQECDSSSNANLFSFCSGNNWTEGEGKARRQEETARQSRILKKRRSQKKI